LCHALKNIIIIIFFNEKINNFFHTIYISFLQQVTIPLQSFSNQAKSITNIVNNDGKDEVKISPNLSIKNNKTCITPGSSNDSILKSIDEDNKSTSSTVSTSSAFEDSINIYSEKSGSSMSSINIHNKHNLNANDQLAESHLNATAVHAKIDDLNLEDADADALEVLSSYDNDSGNDEFDEKGDGFNNFSYSSSDSRSDKKFRYNFNSLPLIRVKKQHGLSANNHSVRRKNYVNDSIEQDFFQDATKLPSPSPSSWSSDSNMIQQQNLSTKSSSVPMLVKNDQIIEEFNKIAVSENVNTIWPKSKHSTYLFFLFFK
jgi:hypothetical protein